MHVTVHTFLKNASMLRYCLTLVVFACCSLTVLSQDNPRDTTPQQTTGIDTTINYDELLDELEDFLDSLLMPRSHFMASISASNGYYNYIHRNSLKLQTEKRLTYTPAMGYYHRSGLGLTLAGNLADDGEKLNFYQFAISPSFDFVKNMDWIGGFSYTRYFAKDSLPFYLSPLQNELSAYFTWKRPWLQPGISLSYGWGSRDEFNKREKLITLLRRRRGVMISSTSREDISDFSLTASVRHSFYWMHIGGEKNYIRFAPQLSFSAGSQNFGFNRTMSTYAVTARRENIPVYNFGDISMDEKMKFQPLSMMVNLRPEYYFGKFFIQPQLILDYYIPASEFAALFAINAGIILH